MNMMLDPMYMQPQPQQDSLRFLHNITQSLVSQVTYAKACRQLIHWCCTLTVYQPQFENALLSCLSVSVFLLQIIVKLCSLICYRPNIFYGYFIGF